MQFFIDTANLGEIREAQSLGILDGVTTNPSLMAKEGITGKNNILSHYKAICDLVDDNVSAEVISTDFDGTNPATATWDLISTVPAGTASAFTPFDPFGPYNLGTYAGKKIYIGFRYQATAGTAASAVGTYEPDDIKITK